MEKLTMISISDIKIMLDDSSNNLSALCKSNKLNIWSRNKPFGIWKVTEVNSPESITDSYRDYWQYNVSRYKMSDFLNYYNDATCPVDKVTYSNNTITLICSLNGTDRELGIADLAANTTLGVAVYRNAVNSILSADYINSYSADYTIDTTVSVHINTANWNKGYYYYFIPFLKTTSNTYIALPTTDRDVLQCSTYIEMDAPLTMRVTASYSTINTKKCNYNIYITNSSSSNKIVTDLTLYWKNSEDDTVYIATVNLGNITIDANSTKTISNFYTTTANYLMVRSATPSLLQNVKIMKKTPSKE